MKTHLRFFLGWLLLHLLAASTPVQAQNDLNLALSKPGVSGNTATASASSSENSSLLPSNANDGDHATRWASQYADQQSLVVSLGSVQVIDRIRITWEQAYAVDFQLQVSQYPDFRTYKVAKEVTDNQPSYHNGQLLNEYSNLGLTGQYVRLAATKRRNIGGSFYGYSIFEFEVFGFTNDFTQNLALNQSATGTNTEDVSLGAGNAFDGDPNTRWSSRGSEYQTLQVDLGSKVPVSRAYVSWENAYATDFELQTAGDQADVSANRWTTFATYSGNQAYYNEVAVTAYGRFFRVLAKRGFGGFSIYEFSLFAGRPLPVTLTSFGAAAQGTGVAVSWTTASELNSASFEVQRGTDGMHFTTLGKVGAAGTSQTAKAYQYFDAVPARPISYYRLKQLDVDGRESYGPVAVVRLAGATAPLPLTIYPNPIADQATLQWEASTAGPGRWSLLSTTGQVVRQGTFESHQGANSQFIDLRTCAAGSYILSVETAGQPLQRQLVQKVQ
jgi:hypothetical protein